MKFSVVLSLLFLFLCCNPIKYNGDGTIAEGSRASAKCKKPRKTYAKEIELALQVEVDSLRSIPINSLNTRLKQKVVRLNSYSTQGLDLDLVLFRICEMSIARGMTNEQTSELIQVAIATWRSSEEIDNIEKNRKKINKDKIEKVLTSTFYEIGDGEARNSIYLSYIINANPKVVARLNLLRDSTTANNKFKSITYLTAPAGYGKSFFLPEIINEIFKEENVCKFRVRKDVVRNNLANIKYVPDLQVLNRITSEKEILNNLPQYEVDFDKFLSFASCEGKKVIILDDLDEVSEETAAQYVNKVSSWLEKRSIGINVIFLGRPEVFYRPLTNIYYSKPRGVTVNYFQNPLGYPEYKTAGDIKLRVKNYLDWYYNDEYEINAPLDTIEYVTNELVSILKKHPFLVQHISLGSNCGYLIEEIHNLTISIDTESDYIKNHLFKEILRRNNDSHGRPEIGSTESFLYQEILELIAVEYSDEINEDGYFEIYENEPITLKRGENIYEFDPKSVLEFSGLITLRPLKRRTHEFRFEPFWLHDYLVDEYNKRSQ